MFRTFKDSHAGEPESLAFEGTGILMEISLPMEDTREILMTFDVREGEHEMDAVIVTASRGFPFRDFQVGTTYIFSGHIEPDKNPRHFILWSIQDMTTDTSEPLTSKRYESEPGMHFLSDPFQKIVMGDQHHAEAIEALRDSRDKSFVLIIETDPEEGKSVLYAYTPHEGTGAALHRMASSLAHAANRYFALAQHVGHQFMLGSMTNPDASTTIEDDTGEDDDDMHRHDFSGPS